MIAPPGPARILGTGRCVPDRVVSNRDLEARLDTTDEWIRARTGIRERRVVPPEWATSDLCERAARAALDMAGVAPDELDLIVVGTATPDMPFPSTACVLQERLGTRGQMAFDLNAGCTGFLYGLSAADALVRAGAVRRALVLGAEVLSKILDWEDRSTCVLFGDGAGAVVVGPTDEPGHGILASRMAADGTHWPLLQMPGGGSRLPLTAERIGQRMHRLRMNGNEVFKIAVRTLKELAVQVLADAGCAPEQLDWLVPHQANRRIIDAVAQRLRLPAEKVYINVDRYGNTSAASIPIALDELVRAGRLLPGQRVLLDAFGAGVTYGATLLRW